MARLPNLLSTRVGSTHFFLIFKFKFIDFKETKFKFIDFEKTKFKFIDFVKSNSNSNSPITRERIQIQIQSNPTFHTKDSKRSLHLARRSLAVADVYKLITGA